MFKGQDGPTTALVKIDFSSTTPRLIHYNYHLVCINVKFGGGVVDTFPLTPLCCICKVNKRKRNVKKKVSNNFFGNKCKSCKSGGCRTSAFARCNPLQPKLKGSVGLHSIAGAPGQHRKAQLVSIAEDTRRVFSTGVSYRWRACFFFFVQKPSIMFFLNGGNKYFNIVFFFYNIKTYRLHSLLGCIICILIPR